MKAKSSEVKVSVIVPVYNTERYLDKCLSSLTGQTLDEIEIIIVNDGSPDNSQEIIDRYAAQHPCKIVALRQENKGLGPARNLGVDTARGRYIGFVDSDDWVEPDMFELMYQAAKAEDADVVMCDFYMVDESSGQCGAANMYSDKNRCPQETAQFVISSTNPAMACNKLFKRDLPEKTSFNSGWYEDLATIPVIISGCERISVVPKPLYYYLKRSGAITSQCSDPGNLGAIKAWERCLSECNSKYRSEMAYAVYLSICWFLDEKKAYMTDYVKFFIDNSEHFRQNRYIEEAIGSKELADLFTLFGEYMPKAAVQVPDSFGQTIAEFLEETAPLLEQLDALPFETAAELHDLYEDAAKAATQNITQIDPELRVRLCDGMDSIIERIVDFSPEFNVTQRNIFSPAIHNIIDRWSNVQLMKDCGICVYLLGKETGMHPVMLFGEAGKEYPYLENLPGMELLLTDAEPHNLRVYTDFLAKYYHQMDVLAIYGMYPHLPTYMNMYRHFRPDGIVYLALDMNTPWMGRTDWGSELVRDLTARCNVIATSCRAIRDALNGNPQVSFPCRLLTNGFYNPTGLKIVAQPDVKENIILTAGRIGDDTKNNQELMIAFALASENLPEWKVHFAGPVEPGFKEVIDEYFRQYPKLRDRVVFTGAITDKAELYREYARAKVFALTSKWEGFPNVYAEALYHGCMFVTSDIDAADEMTNFGGLGVKYKTGDRAALAASLIKICRTADKKAFTRHIPKALAYANKYFDWNRNAKKLAYMLFKESAR